MSAYIDLLLPAARYIAIPAKKADSPGATTANL
jgi:hypothetical protein